MSSYSFDVLKKLAFEKEIEHIDRISDGQYLPGGPKSRHNGARVTPIKEYLKNRIKEIDEEYGEPAVRDF